MGTLRSIRWSQCCGNGTAVRKEAFDDEEALLAAGVQTIKDMAGAGI